MRTLEQDMRIIDDKIAKFKVEWETATTLRREQLERLITLLDGPSRVAAREKHAKQNRDAQAQSAAREATQREIADKQIADFARSARLRFVGTDAEWEQAKPALIARWKEERAMGVPEPVRNREFGLD